MYTQERYENHGDSRLVTFGSRKWKERKSFSLHNLKQEHEWRVACIPMAEDVAAMASGERCHWSSAMCCVADARRARAVTDGGD